ncbi:MarR family winged helix-turn-helix transcriptional regulator [Oceanobacillus salinisoli]|uniref:MarR family winged helix-turn-helix transcriptional regulator n=1 Tax=Oceanobacillus salinisoli TaxID=2678611 RepID=UPI0012E12F6F|nr:MarR family transcriptional regulator [Oceanobacillus salinisoli]
MLHSFFHQNLQFTRSFTKKLNEQLVEVGLYHSQWLIVYYLKQFETATLVDISSYLDVEKPTITRTVNRLEERKLIERIPSTDKRERRIQLTKKGMQVYEEAKHVVASFEQKLMEGIPESDQKATLHTIQLLKRKL